MYKFLSILFILTSLASYSQKKTRILFILDASNSMNLKWDSQTRMESAKEILNELGIKDDELISLEQHNII